MEHLVAEHLASIEIGFTGDVQKISKDQIVSLFRIYSEQSKGATATKEQKVEK